MHRVAALLSTTVALSLASCTHYDYEESYSLEIDGSGTVRLSASDELWHEVHGIGSTAESVELDTVTGLLASPEFTLESATETERDGRRYFHTQIRFDSLDAFCRLPSLAERGCKLERFEDRIRLSGDFGRARRPRETKSAAPRADASDTQRIAFRFHAPAIVRSHNAKELERGNILRWETSAKSYLAGESIPIQAQFDPESIMAVTVRVILVSSVVVLSFIVASLYLVYRKGVRQLEAEKVTAPRSH